ncbi:MAG: hypothetical protein K2Q06_04590 [Parvularculaceae bacterium]|nr:hypothetical protein [Parvularculaceae bacterium]
MRTNPELWRALDAFEIGPRDAALSFRDRLARENGWSSARADAAIVEYKKFIYLAATGERMRTPSVAVDQVWHLHLTYSRSYWEDLCAPVLGRPLHHGPTEGGAREDAKFFAAYQATLDAYAREFGPPPAAFWPDAERRFRPDRSRWVDGDEVWIFSKRKARAAVAAAGAAFVAVSGAAFAAASETAAERDWVVRASIAGVIAFAIVVSAVIFGRGAAASRKSNASGDGGFIPIASCGGGGKGGSDGGHDGGSGCGGSSGCGGGGCGGS